MSRVAVVVLGDLGHSPRMRYHCTSLADQGVYVDFVGYSGSAQPKRLLENDKISIRHLSQCPLEARSCFGLLFKLVWQIFTLFYMLTLKLPKMRVILLQNPPGLPALFVCWLSAKIRGAVLFIDWHNYTWSIFALRYDNRKTKFVRLIERYEFFCGKLADSGVCVTEAMRQDLSRRGVAKVSTLYDRPGPQFRPFNEREKAEFLEYASGEYDEFKFLRRNSLRKTAVLISSTSWTPDENFDILLSALKLYDADVQSGNSNLPEVLMIVTGKGPLREFYIEKAKLLSLNHVTLITPWLQAEDYPKILACSNLGISLHSSSSGLDLPMKVVDMQGCRLPVLALRFNCIDELVQDGVNGYLFGDERQLYENLKRLLNGFPENREFSRLKASCLSSVQDKLSWDENWTRNMLPAIKPYLTQ